MLEFKGVAPTRQDFEDGMAKDSVFSGRVPIGGEGNEPQQPVAPNLVHGGFRSNRFHQAMEELADERGMGREVLRQTDGGYPEDLMAQGNSEIMAGASPVGKSDYHVSKWSKGK